MKLPDLALAAEALANDSMGELPADVDTLAHLLVEARRAKRAISDVERAIESALATAMPKKQITVQGVGTLERRKGNDRKAWDHERLGARIAALSRDERVLDESTGVIEGEAEAAVRVLLACARPDYRVTALRERGLDPDDYCLSEPGRTSVQVIA